MRNFAIKRTMQTQGNIISIYYNIGRRLPFLVKRIRGNIFNPELLLNKKGRTFLVEKVKPNGIGGKFGHAYGKTYIDGELDNKYWEQFEPANLDCEIPCAGCGGWVLIEVPGFTMGEIFPPKKANDIVSFGMHKGKTYGEVAMLDKKYIFWLIENKQDMNIDLFDVFGIDSNDEYAKEKLKSIINEVYPKIKVDDVIGFGKFKGKTWREVNSENPEYVRWALRNIEDKDFDTEDFNKLFEE